MLTILFVVLAIIYVIIGMMIGAVIEAMLLSKDMPELLAIARSAFTGEEIDSEQAGKLIGLGFAVALIALVWPVCLIWAYTTSK